MHSSDTAYLWNHCKWNCKWRCGSLVSFILSKEHVAHPAKVQQKNRCSVLHTCSSSRIAAVADSRGCTSNCLSNVVSGRIASKFMHCRVQYHSTVHYNAMQVDQLCVTGGGEAAVAAAAGQRHQLAPHSVHTSWLRKPVHHQHQHQRTTVSREFRHRHPQLWLRRRRAKRCRSTCFDWHQYQQPSQQRVARWESRKKLRIRKSRQKAGIMKSS